jgi:hypothetical protein
MLLFVNQTPLEALLFPADGRQPHLVDLPFSTNQGLYVYPALPTGSQPVAHPGECHTLAIYKYFYFVPNNCTNTLPLH